MEIILPIKTCSEANQNTHWRIRYKRSLAQKAMTKALLQEYNLQATFPCHIHLVRLSPGTLDSDNLPSALKYIRDAIADYLIPGLKPGRADSTDKITWSYEQKKSKTYQVNIYIDQK